MPDDHRPCCEIYDDGRFVALGLVSDDGSVEVTAGETPDDPQVVLIEPSRSQIALIADADGRIEREANALYPERIVGPGELDGARFAIVACDDAELRASVDWSRLNEFAHKGGTVIASLDDYAHARDLTLKQRTRVDRPHLEVVAPHELFGGCSVGTLIPWHNLHLDRPIFSFRGFRYVEGFVPDESRSILARDDTLRQPVAVEETVGQGRIIALDLLEPRQEAGGVDGSRNKWVLPGNILGESVQWSRWWPERLDYDAQYPSFLAELERTYDRVEVHQPAQASDGSPLYTMRVGDEGKPAFMLVGALHGTEVMNPHGLLALAESLCRREAHDPRIAWLFEHFQLIMLPIMNPWGYRHSIQSSMTDCDLNRNFPACWDEYAGDPGRWFSNYTREQFRGPAPFSEPETRLVRDLCASEPVIGLIDYHQHQWAAGHHYMFPGDSQHPLAPQIRFGYHLARERLRNRFLRDSDNQLDFRLSEGVTRKPFLRRWADEQGIAAITQETVGYFEDSFSNGEVVAEVALAFIQSVGLQYLASEGQQ